MTPSDLRNDWPALFSSLRARFPNLTDDVLIDVDADIARLETAVASSQALSRSDAREAVAEWMNGPEPADAYAHPTHDDAAISESNRYIPDGEEASDDDARFGDDGKLENPVDRRS